MTYAQAEYEYLNIDEYDYDNDDNNLKDLLNDAKEEVCYWKIKYAQLRAKYNELKRNLEHD